MSSLRWKAMAIAVTLLLLCFSREVESSLSLSDKILELPGQPQVGFQQYSGYVAVDEKQQRALFYYFAEAETDPAIKPLVLWLNGGLLLSTHYLFGFCGNAGMWGGHGPSGELLVRNEYSWNREANMLYLETPIGVGFSYSTDSSSYAAVNDKITARDNLVFLQKWLLKFPQYKNRDLFITGESYAGHYVPQLAELMLQFNKKEKLFNLKGIAFHILRISPGVFYLNCSWAIQFWSLPLISTQGLSFFWSHGLISDSTYKMFTSFCNYSRYVSEYYRGSVSSICSRVMSQVGRETSRFVDKYDVTLDVCISSVLSQSKVLSPQQVTETIDVCVEDETESYLNRRDVQKALHARLVGVNKCILDYELLDLEIPTISIVGKLIKAGIPVLVYSGDQDSVIPLTGSRTLVHGLAEELGLNTTVPYRVWFEGKQVGGWTQVYGNILSFATIRGASHEAPFSQPERSLVLFRAFLGGRPLPQAF
ncbi:Serine carboxypeptidase-like 45 [Vitis vinifera]|uniref:Carboxypeptidase n=1 Tax=Vitis vinifera TaxID=29760 RepID=A0A438D186_VITVI|nr:Serine carboxypeptidase-like 45 [Vitis vinifera]